MISRHFHIFVSTLFYLLMKKSSHIPIFVILALLASCSGQIDPEQEHGDAISFSLQQDFSAEVTKAYLYESDDLPFQNNIEGNFSVMAYNSRRGSRHFDNPEWVHHIYYPSEPTMSRWYFWNGTSVYSRYWPKSYELDFFAYMPYDAHLAQDPSNANIALDLDHRTITCDLPSDKNGENSTDGQRTAREFVYAWADNYTYETDNGNVDLDFIHPLTAIYFYLGQAHGNTLIESVGLRNLYSTGTLEVSEVNSEQENLTYSDWTPAGSRGSMTVDVGKTVGASGENGINLNSPIGGPYLVMPQATGDIYVTVRYTWNGNSISAEAVINGDNWKPGYKYTYILNLGNSSENIIADVSVTPWNKNPYPNDIEIE